MLAILDFAWLVAIVAAFQINPWPSALFIRLTFDWGGSAANKALAKHVPANISTRRDLPYAEGDSQDTLFDVYVPSEIEGTATALPAIVWVHGGGFVSGSKEHVANYLKILAGKGFTTIGVNYAIAPGATYPTPVRQLNAALGHIVAHAAELHVDPARIVLAGDSAGAHIAAQMAAIVTAPVYAAAMAIVPSLSPGQLAGTILYCGPYDLRPTDARGMLGWFTTAVLWSYSGGRDFATNAKFASACLTRQVTSDFPPAFISCGNGDPLLPESLAFAEALQKLNVKVDRLFFGAEQTPPLPHEYQFDLDTEAGQLALARSVEFLHELFVPRA